MALQRPWPVTAAGWLYIVHGVVAGMYCALLLTSLVVTEVLSAAGLFGGAYLVVTSAPLTAFWGVAYCIFLAVVSRVHDLSASIEWLRALHRPPVQPGT